MLQEEKPRSWSECIQFLWSKDENEILDTKNTDGLIYLSYIKYVAILLSAMSLFALTLLVPVYSKLADSTKYLSPWQLQNYSLFDKLTLSNGIDDFDTTKIVILVTYLFCVFAYFLLYLFCSKMSQLQFYSANAYMDQFVASHSVIIRGVNTQIGTEEASKKIGKVFSQRFKDQNVMACSTFRKYYPMKKLWQNVKIYRKKLNQV